MPTESVCHVARSWVDVGSFQLRLFGAVYFDIASVREFLDTPLYVGLCRYLLVIFWNFFEPLEHPIFNLV
jgi:hypothetical protein